MKNEDIAGVFAQLADLLEIQEANPFRVRAYRNGARKIQSTAESLSALLEAGGDLTQFEGCLLYTSPSPRDKRQSRMPSSA